MLFVYFIVYVRARPQQRHECIKKKAAAAAALFFLSAPEYTTETRDKCVRLIPLH
jgi:hypothetical protein